MSFFHKIWSKISKPHGFWLAAFYVLFALTVIGTVVLLVLGGQMGALHYVLFVLSALGLTYFVFTAVYFAPKIRQRISASMQKHKFTDSLLKDYGFRTVVISVVSLVINVAYISFVAVMAFMSRTAWYFSITVYYILLALMKANVFYSKRRFGDRVKEARAFRFSGIMFILITVAFSGVIVLIYKANRYFEYAGLLIYAVAAFTFYKLGVAIFNIFKAKRQSDLYVQNIRNINFASALISLIILQVALFQAFSPQSNLGFANAATGGAVSLIIIVMGILMIVKANKRLHCISNEPPQNENNVQKSA